MQVDIRETTNSTGTLKMSVHESFISSYYAHYQRFQTPIQGFVTVAVTRNKQAHCHRTEKSTGNECKYQSAIILSYRNFFCEGIRTFSPE